MRYADFALTLALWLSLLPSLDVIGASTNVTVDDSDPSILYQPQEFWFTNSEDCTACLYPAATLAFNNSYHFGNYNITPTDDFDITTTSNSEKEDDHMHSGGNARKDPDDDLKSHGMRQEMWRRDSDDKSVDTSVTAQFKFIGTAVYLFCIEPLAASSSSTTSTITNLTFVLDNAVSSSFVHVGSSSASGFASNVPVLSLEDLNDGPHILLLNVLPDSVFILDYLVYTTNEQILSSTSTSSTISPTASMDNKNTNHRNIGTFAGAVGGSVGVLGTLALCLFLSIWTRRRRSAKRERLEQARERELGSSRNIPPTIGPAPFIPRYFPRVGPAAPPPYVGPSHNVEDTSFFHTSPPSPITETSLPPLYRADVNPVVADPLSYADIPPSAPPPPLLEEVASLEAHWIALPPSPPPPFGEIIANPASTSSREAEIPIPSPTYAHHDTTLTNTSQQDTDVDTVTEDPGIPISTPPG
ncbi:hypothetical protein J3R30DRAFT_90610 [Lentinula aciculospora]|uniref:Uncharacterized protein n=1 Tax=Lentinula aciculospora TaxID=153920 RepID=A0A9W9DXE7_9AGAR|nr:hypothetical protein J3R30DRAFT_90610 [Lentinula aciculospora]